MKQRLDQAMHRKGLVASRSQAESWIKLGKVQVNDRTITKPGFFVEDSDAISMEQVERYVSRAGLKLASVTAALHLDFKDKVMLDVGSSTGGFTDYAVQHGAKKVIAVDVGTKQMHPSLRDDARIALYEQTDIRDVRRAPSQAKVTITDILDLVVIDVSFISLREILPHVAALCAPHTKIVAMVKPQFEATAAHLKHKGIIKNDRMRRDILKSFEEWVRNYFIIKSKADSDVAGAKGNIERFYLLMLV